MSIAYAISDSLALTQRNLVKTMRNLTIIVWGAFVPILTAVLYAFVLGSAIEIPGVSYREYMVVGILVNAVLTASTNTAVGIGEDMKKGLIDRFRSLPIAQASVLIGRTTSDLLNVVLTVALMAVTGLLIGWRIRSSFIEALAGFGLLLLFAYAAMWITAWIGVRSRSVEVMANSLYLFLMPLVFVSNAFVPTAGMPGWLRPIAEWNPVSAVVSACRVLFGNVPPATEGSWPMANPITATLLYVAVILLIFVPLATRRFRKTVGQ